MSEEAKAVLSRCVDEVWNKGNLAAVERFYTRDYNHQDPLLPETRGVEAFKQLVSMIHKAFPDLRYILEDVIAEGDKVVGRYTFQGTHRGEFLGVIATGKQVIVTGTSTFRISGGKIAESWNHWDSLGEMQQLGVVTLPASK